MKELFAALAQTLESGQSAVLVTVTAAEGSTPRGAGARMLVAAAGRLAGTVGGGLVEYRCIQRAGELLGTARPLAASFALNREERDGLDMACGGQLQVLFTPVPAGDGGVLALCRDALGRFAAGEPFWLFTPLDEGAPLTLWPPREGERDPLPPSLTANLPRTPALLEGAGRRWLAEPMEQPGVVYLFGGGHVSQALVPVLAPLGFSCVVLEDRPEYADPARFPGARAVRLVDFSRLAEQLQITEEDYLCIMTRGHEHDLLVQQQVLASPARYIGLMGSRRKAEASRAGAVQQEIEMIGNVGKEIVGAVVI